MRKTLRLPLGCVAGVLCALACMVSIVQAQNYADYMDVPVTFYDFMSDRTNPEFEQPHMSGLRRGMVEDMLDLDGKPVARRFDRYPTPTPMNQGIRFWFRGWNGLSQYQMAGQPDPVTQGRTYLERFRPIYMYQVDQHRTSEDFIQPPPGFREYVDVANIRGDGWVEGNAPFVWVGNAYGTETTMVAINRENNRVNKTYTIRDAYRNRVIPANLLFRHVGGQRNDQGATYRNGTYQFERIFDCGNCREGGNWDDIRGGFFPFTDAREPNDPNLVRYPNGNAVRFMSNHPDSIPFNRSSGWSSWNSANKDRTRNWAYSFTMELKTEFRFERGLRFDFSGDDDVWLFINRRLVTPAIDLGGVHETVHGSINLDDLGSVYGLRVDEPAELHFFYSERHTDGSTIRITTNILSARLDSISIVVEGETMTAGQPKLAAGIIHSDLGDGRWTNYENGEFTWSARYVDNGRPVESIATAIPGRPIEKSDSILVTATRAHTVVEICGIYEDRGLGQTTEGCKEVRVLPGPPTAVYIENRADSTVAWYHTPDTAGVISIPSQDTLNSTPFFAVLRDQWNNWVGPAFENQSRSLSWATQPSDIARVRSKTVATADSKGEGQARKLADGGETRATVTYTMPGSTLGPSPSRIIRIEDVQYNALAIGRVVNGTFDPLAYSFDPPNSSTLRMSVNETATLHVYMRRADTQEWVSVSSADWTIGNIPGVSAANAVGNVLTMTPTGATSTGTVAAENGGLRASLNVEVSDLPASAMRFFTRRGTPDFNEFREWLLPAGLPATARMYPVPSTVLMVTAGANVPIVAKMFTADPPGGAWLGDLEAAPGLNSRWQWSFVPGTLSNLSAEVRGRTSINGTAGADARADGDSITFRSTAAHHTYQLQGVYTDGGREIRQRIDIMVLPDTREPQLVIEDARPQGDLLNVVNRLGEFSFSLDDTQRMVYANLRDQYGNFITASGAGYALDPSWPTSPRAAGWTPPQSDGQAVYANGGHQEWGEGIIIKTDAAGTNVWVTAQDNNLTVNGRAPKDSVLVRILGYSYTAVQIVQSCPGGDIAPGYCRVPDGTLRMTTNDEPQQVFVLGQRSDNEQWELVDVTWGSDQSLVGVVSPPPVNTVNNRRISPITSGQGKISVSRPGSGGTTLTHEIDLIITSGPPNRVELHVISPEHERRAGHPIRLEVRYFNRAGYVEWDPSWANADGSLFEGTLGTIGDWIPLVNTELGDKTLYYNGFTGVKAENAKLTVENGRAILTVTLYLAAENHQVRYGETLQFGGGTYMTAITDPFRVSAGDPHGIEIKADGKQIVNDTLHLDFSRDDDVILRVVGKDLYGNETGDTPSDWASRDKTADGVPGVEAGGRALVLYPLGTATENGAVRVCADAGKNSLGEDMVKCIIVNIKGVTTLPSTLITRDYDGCGYLDAIELKFRRQVFLTEALESSGGRLPNASMIRVTGRGNVVIEVDSVTVNPADSSAILWLRENRSTAPQTGWTPTVIINEGVFIDASTGDRNPAAIDGAAPVISTAKLFFPSSGTGNIRENYIDVAFSEAVRTPNRNSFRDDLAAYKPIDLFNIWTMGSSSQHKRTSWMSKRQAARLARRAHDPDGGNVYELQANYLDGITQVHFVNDSTLRFYLENDKELGPPRHHINIRTDVPGEHNVHVWDRPTNKPRDNNRKVPITYGNAPNEQAKPIPNPATPDDRLVDKGVIIATHNPEAIPHIQGGGGGTVFEVPIYVPNSPGSKVRCQLKVYDLAGNLVIAGESDRVREDFMNNQGEYTKLHLYWNGFNSKAMKVAPGTYRMVVQISYSGNLTSNEDKINAKNRKFQGLVGISK